MFGVAVTETVFSLIAESLEWGRRGGTKGGGQGDVQLNSFQF